MEFYSPAQTAKILSRSGSEIGERRIRQMCQDGEIEGAERTDTGRWRIPAATVHQMLQERREREQLEAPERALEAPQSVTELRARVEELQYRLGRSEAILELTERAESTLREQLERERERADRLEQELAEARRPWYRRLFGG